MDERKLLDRITMNPKIFGGKPIIRGRRLAVEHVLGMLARAIVSKRSWRAIPGWNARMCKLASFMPASWSGMSGSSRYFSKSKRKKSWYGLGVRTPEYGRMFRRPRLLRGGEDENTEGKAIMNILLDSCVWGGGRVEIAAAGHDVIWTGDWPEDPGDADILARGTRRAGLLSRWIRTSASWRSFAAYLTAAFCDWSTSRLVNKPPFACM